MKVKVFIKNTITLVLTSLILRSVGIFFRVFLAKQIGSEGVGLYQLIFSVYMLVATFATTGISTAVTRLVSANIEKGIKAVKKIMQKAVLVTIVVGGATSVITFLFAPVIAKYWIKDLDAVNAIKILSFSLTFMGISSCVRGYFIARRKAMEPSATQLLEQAVRIAVIVFALKRTIKKGAAAAASAVLFGDTVAETVSCLAVVLLYYADRRKIKGNGEVKGVTREIVRISLPLVGAGYLSTALHTAENLLVPTRMTNFYGARERGLELYGAIRGMAMPILFFPASFLTSLSTMLIPEVSESTAKGDRRELQKTVATSLRTTLGLSVFVGCVFFFWGKDIANVFYHDQDVGYIIKHLSVIVPFMYMESVSAGILKGLDRQKEMFGYNLFDSGVRIAAVFLLLPKFGIDGYLGIMIVSNILTSSLCLRQLLKTSGVGLKVGEWVLKPLAVSLAAGVGSVVLFSGISVLTLRLVLSLLFQISLFVVYFVSKEQKEIRVINSFGKC